jgi:phosphate-selective porin OprO/OprP
MLIMKFKAFILSAVALAVSASSFGQIKVKTESGDMNVRFMGRTNFDAGTFVASSDDNLKEHNGIAMNDTRLGVLANFDEKFSAKIEICYASKAISFRDLWIGYKLNDNSTITAGNHFQPYGAKPLGLSYKFVEDASTDLAFCPARKIGVSYAYTSDPFNLTAGLFSDGNVDNGKNIDKGWSAAAKAIFRPIIDETTVLHIGLAPMFVQSPNAVSFTGSIPTTVVTNKLIGTANLNPDNYLRMEAEAIFISGKLYVEGHYMAASLNSFDVAVKDTAGNVVSTDSYNAYVDGFYAQASFLIKGDQQNYNKKTGLAANASPKSLEVLARVSHLNLDADHVKAGQQTDFTVGLNYFFNKNLNLKLNAIYATVKDGENYTMVQSRLQFSF